MHSNFYAISEHVVNFRVIPESPSWLITRGRIKEAKQMLIKVAKFNKQEIPKILLSDEDSSYEGVATISGKKYTTYLPGISFQLPKAKSYTFK